MTNNIELLSQYDNFTIGTNSNLSEILANVVKIGTDTSNVTISIPQDISSSYNLILPVRQGTSGESLVYGADGQLKWDDPSVLKQVVSIFGSTLASSKVDSGEMSSVSFPENYQASITPLSANTKIFVQFKVNYKAALSSDNQVDFHIYKYINNSGTPDKIFTETMYGPFVAAGGFVGQYISNLIDEPNTTDEIRYKLGYKINGTVDISDTLGILGHDLSYNNTIVLQEFEGSGVYATSVWNKGADSNGLYYNDGTVHIGSTKDALGSQNTSGVALELSGNLVGTNATFSGNIYAHAFHVQEAHVGPNTLFVGGIRVLNQNEETGSVNVYTDQIVSDASNGLTIQANGNNGNIILDPSGTGSIQLNGEVQLSGGNINAETFIGDLSGNVNAITMAATTTTTNNLSLDGTLTTSNSTRVEGNLIPSANITYDLGSSTHMWRDVYLGPGSLYVNNKKVIEDNSHTINITTDEGQNLKIKTSGDGGQLQIQSEIGGIAMSKSGTTGDITITTTSGGDINMNAYDNVQITAGDDLQLTSTTGTIQLKSAVNITHGMTVSNPTGDDIKIDDNLQITGQVKTNEIIEYTTNSGVTIENVLIKDGNVSGNLVGNVTGTVSSLSNHTTDNLTQGSTNKYFSTTLVDSYLSGGTGVTYSNGSISIGQSVGISDNVKFNNVTIDGTLNSDDITGSNVTVSNDLVVSGNLTVNGTRTIVNATTLDIGDNKIVVNAAGSTTDAGIIANVSGTEHEFIYSTNNNAWGTTGDLNIGGNVTGTTFIGNLIGAITMNGHIIPSIGNTFDIGSPDRQIRDMYVSNNTIYLGELITLSVDEQTSQLKVKRRKTDVIPKAIRDANPTITDDDILTATFGSDHGKQLSDLKMSHYRRYARNNLTIGGKSSDNIEISDIFTNDAENWEEDISLETLNNTLTQIQENMNISGNLTVGSNVTIGGQLLIDTINENTTNNGVVIEGVTINSGNVTATTLSVENDVNISGNININGDASFENVDISGNVTVTQTFDVGGTINGVNAVFSNNVTGDLIGNVTGDLVGNVTGDLVGGVTGDLIGNVTGTVSSLSNHTTDNLAQGLTNKYYSDTLVDDHLSGVSGVTYNNGQISIGQGVRPTDSPEFKALTLTDVTNSSNGLINFEHDFGNTQSSFGAPTGKMTLAQIKGNLRTDGTTKQGELILYTKTDVDNGTFSERLRISSTGNSTSSDPNYNNQTVLTFNGMIYMKTPDESQQSYIYQSAFNNRDLTLSSYQDTTGTPTKGINFMTQASDRMRIGPDGVIEMYNDATINGVKIGNVHASSAPHGWFGIANANAPSTGDGNYALIHSDGGATILNASNGQKIYFRIDHASSGRQMIFDGTKLEISQGGYGCYLYAGKYAGNQNIDEAILATPNGNHFLRFIDHRVSGSFNQQIYIGRSGSYNQLFIFGNYFYQSDDRLKHQEVDIENGLDLIRQLQPQKYKKTSEKKDADYVGELEDNSWKWESGLIAQDVAKIPDLSHCVQYNSEEDLYFLNYNDIFATNIAATKELDKIVQSQKAEIDSFTTRLTALDATVQTQQTEINELKAEINTLKDENTLLKSKLNEILSEMGKETI